MSWLYKRTLSFAATDEANKQVLITLTTANFDYTKCSPFGDDLRFGPDPNASYTYHIRNWNHLGSSEICVKVPDSGTASMLVWYGNSTITTPASNAAATYIFFDDFELADIWDKGITILSGTQTWEAGHQVDCTGPHASTNPLILTGAALVYKWWWCGGEGATWSLGYGESLSPFGPIVKYSGNPVIENYSRTMAIKSGGIFYIFAARQPDARIDLFTNNDLNTTLTLDTAGVIAPGAPGQWDDTNVANVLHIFIEDGTWNIFYGGSGDGGATWGVGLASGPDPRTLTKFAGNPVTSFCTNKIGAAYYGWNGFCATPGANLPNDIFRSTGTSISNLAWSPTDPVLPRRTYDEGADNNNGQIVVSNIWEDGGKSYIMGSSAHDGASADINGTIKLWRAHSTLSTLITGQENNYTPSLAQWTVHSGVLTPYKNFSKYADSSIASNTQTIFDAASATGSESLSYVIEGSIKWPAYYSGIMYRRSAAKTMYVIRFDPSGALVVARYEAGVATAVLLNQASGLSLNVWYRFTLRVSPAGVVAFTINGTTYNWTDNVLPAGTCGVFLIDSIGGTHYGRVQFDNWIIRKYYAADPVVTVGAEESGGGSGSGIFGRGIGIGLIA